jgi:hypothetical protein
MDARGPGLDPADVQAPRGQLDLVPLNIAQLRLGWSFRRSMRAGARVLAILSGAPEEGDPWQVAQGARESAMLH